jgi:hypothetical protein
MLEHGFRQYLPTFFYDLCAQNKERIKLTSLGLFFAKKTQGIDMLDLYKKLDPLIFPMATQPALENTNASIRLGKFTGLATALLNKSTSPVMLTGVISKVEAGRLNFSVSQ